MGCAEWAEGSGEGLVTSGAEKAGSSGLKA